MPMFCFYPDHEFACPNLKHCPHLGGAAIGTVVHIANTSDQCRELDFHQIRTLQKINDEQLSQVVDLQKQLEQAKLELKLERQNKFATNEQKNRSEETQDDQQESTETKEKAKRGAPVGHPGWFRPTPTQFDWEIEVPAPSRCPCCGCSDVSVLDADPIDHLQEDIIDGKYCVVLYHHAAAKCGACGKMVQRAGADEILNSRIGPGLRSKAIYLRNVIGISYRKVPDAIQEMFGIGFTPATLIGFEKALAKLAEPIVDDTAKKLSSTDGPVHADETYWTLDGERAYFWVHGNEKFIHFKFDTSRAGINSRDVLGWDFTGTLVTDCYSGYHAQVAGAKQKCLAHLARTARDWQKLTEQDSIDHRFFSDVQQFVKRACKFHRDRNANVLSEEQQTGEIEWLRTELERLCYADVKHEKSITLQGRLLRHLPEWLVFIDDRRVSPTNNLAERALRPLVVLRKITFGSRTRDGGDRMADLMTVAETARRHGRRASDIYYWLYTRPPDRVLRGLYASV